MRATFTVNREDTRRLLDGIAKTTGQTSKALLVDVMRLWGSDLVRMTFPRSQKTGKDAIKKDLDKIIVARDVETLAEWEAVSGGITFPGRIFKRKNGSVYGVDNNYIFFGEDGISAIHQEQRSAKTGRVSTAGQETRDIGRWKFVKKIHTTSDIKRRYVARTQKRVGRLKAGWLAVVNKLGGKAPGWVRKHGDSEGSYRDTLNVATMEGHLVAENNVPYANQKIDQAFMDLIERKRINDLTKGYYAKRWQKKTEAAIKR